jgi:regulator of RNase E activity RraB
MFWRKKKSVQVVGDSWAVYSYAYGEGMQAVISFDVGRAREAEHQGYGDSIRVIVHIPLVGRVMENGLPVREELIKLERFEDGVLQTLEKRDRDCLLVGRMTYGGMRELIFQVADVPGFKKSAAEFKNLAGDYEIEFREEPGWRFFDQKVCPKPVFWQQINDRAVIGRLIESGSDPEIPHLLEHVILGDEDKLQKIRDELVKNGFVEVSLRSGCLVLGRDSKLNVDDVFSVTGRLFGYCEAMGVVYDGWGAAVVK